MGVPRALGHAAAVTALALTGCDNSDASLAKVDKFISDTRMDTLERRVGNNETQVAQLRSRSLPVAILTMSDNGYSTANTDLGVITYQMLAIDAQGSGSRVRLRIGNPTAAELTRLDVEGSWGTVDKDGSADFEHEHPFKGTITGSIKPGMWGSGTLPLSGAKPSEVGFVAIEKTRVSAINLMGTPE